MMDLNHEIAARLLLSAALGGAIGLEREYHHKSAGLRTSMLICLGACFFMIVSWSAATHPEDDHTRIAAQIVAGIGFLGAGVILRERGSVVGLTTAATVWATASVGTAVGIGMYVTSIFATGLILFALIVLGWFEQRIGIKLRLTTFRLTTMDAARVMKQARQIFVEQKIRVRHTETHRTGTEAVIEFDADVSLPQEHEILRRFSELGAARCEASPVEFYGET
jgi:putative Mg2+ transporter-C (MgtC) family protein